MKPLHPLRSTKGKMQSELMYSYKRIKKDMGEKKYEVFKAYIKKVGKGEKVNSLQKKKGMSYSHAKILHIVSGFNTSATIDKSKPDLYVLGGVGGSGKTYYLARKYIKEPTVVIDADAYKEALMTHHNTPVPGYNMAHSAYLHKESSVIAKKATMRALKERRDVTIDSTMGNLEKARKIIQQFKDAGYDVHVLATQMQPENAIHNTTTRFLDSKAKVKRFVPPLVIKHTGNATNRNVVAVAIDKDDVNSAVIVNTNGIVTKAPIKEIYKRGETNKDYENPEK